MVSAVLLVACWGPFLCALTTQAQDKGGAKRKPPQTPNSATMMKLHDAIL